MIYTAQLGKYWIIQCSQRGLILEKLKSVPPKLTRLFIVTTQFNCSFWNKFTSEYSSKVMLLLLFFFFTKADLVQVPLLLYQPHCSLGEGGMALGLLGSHALLTTLSINCRRLRRVPLLSHLGLLKYLFLGAQLNTAIMTHKRSQTNYESSKSLHKIGWSLEHYKLI